MIKRNKIFSKKKIFFLYKFWGCTIRTSETELIDSTYIVTPTSTGGPGTYYIKSERNKLNTKRSILIDFIIERKKQREI